MQPPSDPPLRNGGSRLRHTHATLLLQAGVNPKIVSERLGHHSVAFTLDTYAHVLPGMQAEAARDFSDLVFGIVVDEHLHSREQQAQEALEPGATDGDHAGDGGMNQGAM